VPGSSEALHGIRIPPPRPAPGAAAAVGNPAGEGTPTTSFGQVIGMGETWDPALIERAGAIAGYEARFVTQSAKYHHPTLVLWGPNAELDRDARWGREEESYGEDPFLVGTMAAAYVRGIQGHDPKYWQAAALVKHFFANSNETTRASSSSDFDERQMREYYSVPFRMTFIEGGAKSIMASYNAWNGVPMAANPMLKTVLRDEWGLNGLISSDAGAIEYMVNPRKYVPSAEDAWVAVIKVGGLNQFLARSTEDFIIEALKDGKLKESDLDAPILGKLRTILMLGLLDPPADVPYSSIGMAGDPDPWTLPEHKEVARKVVEESIVLLKNEGGFLPLNKGNIKKIAVIGKNADKVLAGAAYDPVLPYAISPLQGIREAAPTAEVIFAADNANNAAVNAARGADAVIMIEGDEPFCGAENIGGQFVHDGSTKPCPDPGWGREGRDRERLDLSQEEVVKAVYVVNPKTVLVIISGYSFAVNWSQQHLPSILHLAHASQERGTGLAEVLFGTYNPAGRTNQTWPVSVSQLPPLEDYDITHGRTYMYSKQKPLYAFGHGLSYTTFAYSNLVASQSGSIIRTRLNVKNTGKRDGDEVVQLYVSHQKSAVSRPSLELKAFQRVFIPAGQSKSVTLEFPVPALAYWDVGAHAFHLEIYSIEIGAGAASDDIRAKQMLAVK
jgi:beta-glucosidase